MLEFETLEGLIEAPKVVFNEMEAMMEKVKQELEDDVDIFNLEFMEYLGGNVFLLAEIEDLKAIVINDGTLITNVSQFDIAFLTKDLSFVVIVSITSNAGGATYFIPRDIYMAVPTVLMSVLLTNYADNINSFIDEENAGL